MKKKQIDLTVKINKQIQFDISEAISTLSATYRNLSESQRKLESMKREIVLSLHTMTEYMADNRLGDELKAQLDLCKKDVYSYRYRSEDR